MRGPRDGEVGTTPRWVWVAVASALAAMIVGTVAGAISGELATYTAEEVASQFGITLLATAFLTVGVLITRRQPGNAIGRLFLGAGWSWAMAFMVYPLTAELIRRGSPDAAGLTEALTNALAALWVPAIAAALLLFPDGKPPTARWRWLVAVIWAAAVMAVVAPLLNGGWGGDVDSVIQPNPIRDDLAPLGDIAAAAFTILMLVSTTGASVAVVVRFRRSRGEERLQLKWLAFAALLAIGLSVLLVVISEGAAADTPLLLFASTLVIGFIPVGVGIAVVKYRLYDIDLVIRRTASYAVVVVVLAVVFATGIVVLGNLAPVEGDLAVVVSTLAVFTLFNPLRRWVQRAIDRKFHRLPYDPEAVTAELVQRLSRETDAAAIANLCVEVVARTVRPVMAAMWTRE